MTTLAAPPRTDRLLASWHSSQRPDIESHVATHGPSPLPTFGDADWAARLIGEIEASGLTGRGGGGFTSWRKLESVRSAAGAPTIVVNAMEGEPASAKDQVLLNCVPHLVMDGAQLTAAAVGARRVIICIADDADGTAQSVLRAISERRARTIDPISVEIIRPPGHFTTGEESALASWLDHGRAVPSFRTDKSIPLRVKRRPVLIHNAETLAHMALISRHGSIWFRERGTKSSPGTALVTVSGSVENPGVHEIALGSPVSEIIRQSVLLSEPQAVIVGGYGGSLLGPEELGVGFSREELAIHGATTGCGVLAVLPRSTCGVAETARIARYLARQSSKQCGPCTFGLPALATSLENLWRGDAPSGALRVLEQTLGQVEGRGACRHPDGAVRLVVSALRVFAGDFASHAAGRPCRWANRGSVLAFGRPASECRSTSKGASQ